MPRSSSRCPRTGERGDCPACGVLHQPDGELLHGVKVEVLVLMLRPVGPQGAGVPRSLLGRRRAFPLPVAAKAVAAHQRWSRR